MDNKKKLVINNTDLMKDWDWEENSKSGLNPNFLSCGSNKVAHWKCHVCGYKFTTRIERKNKGSKCKKCLEKTFRISSFDKSFAFLYPDLLKEWDYEKNKVDPKTVYPQSNIKYWWKCEKGHEYMMPVNKKVNRNYGCPVCSNKKVLAGENDLSITYPDLLKEWDYEKNSSIGIYPNNLSYGSKKIVFWKCNKGHSWRAPVYSRTTGNCNCPYCSKELRVSFPEKAIYYYVSKIVPDAIENYKCKKLGKFELDIFVPSLNIGIEYDGSKWHENIEKDLKKDVLCSKLGINLIRIREEECPNYLSDSIKIVVKYRNDISLSNAIKRILEIINKKTNKNIINNDVDIRRDSQNILANVLTIKKENSIVSSSFIADWDYEKNKGIDPNLISLHSNKVFWWKCSKCGHEWRTAVSHRAEGKNCPYCSNQKVIKGFNDLESKFPNLMKEWDYGKNDFLPDNIAPYSNKKAWWKCSKCGHEWRTSIYVRTGMGCGCPSCKAKTIAHKCSKKVIDLDANILYLSVTEASRKTGIPVGSISSCCLGKTKTAGKHRWKYIN